MAVLVRATECRQGRAIKGMVLDFLGFAGLHIYTQ